MKEIAFFLLILVPYPILSMIEMKNEIDIPKNSNSKTIIKNPCIKLSCNTQPAYANVFYQFIRSTRTLSNVIKNSKIQNNIPKSSAIELLDRIQNALSILRKPPNFFTATVPSFDDIKIDNPDAPSLTLGSLPLSSFIKTFISFLGNALRETGSEAAEMKNYLFGFWMPPEQPEFPVEVSKLEMNPIVLIVGRQSCAEAMRQQFISRVTHEMSLNVRSLQEIVPVYIFATLSWDDVQSKKSHILLPFFHPIKYAKKEKGYAYIAQAFFYKSEQSARYLTRINRQSGWVEVLDDESSYIDVTNEVPARITEKGETWVCEMIVYIRWRNISLTKFELNEGVTPQTRIKNKSKQSAIDEKSIKDLFQSKYVEKFLSEGKRMYFSQITSQKRQRLESEEKNSPDTFSAKKSLNYY